MKNQLAPLDSPDLVERLKADLIATYQPTNSEELFAIERVAFAQQALRRCAILETKLFEASLTVPESDDPAEAPTLPFLQPAHLKAWQIFLRYQTQTERLYRKALEDLYRILALRDETAQTEEEPSEPELLVAAMPLRLPRPSAEHRTVAGPSSGAVSGVEHRTVAGPSSGAVPGVEHRTVAGLSSGAVSGVEHRTLAGPSSRAVSRLRV